MIRYSHVSLVIPCNLVAADEITKQLSIKPTRVRHDQIWQRRPDGSIAETTSYTWMLDSPTSAEEAPPVKRLEALLSIVEPHGEALQRLDAKFKRWVDLLYHVTPQHSHGVLGEFDRICLPVDLMRRLVNLNLYLSNETIWFDHPDWVAPKR